MDNKKIAIQCEHSSEGPKIIETLCNLGGMNNLRLAGCNVYTYYFIEGITIKASYACPAGYTPTTLTEFKNSIKSFPRVMMVYMKDPKMAVPRVVITQKCDKYIAWKDAETLEGAKLILSVASWPYAYEVGEKVIELTKDEIAEKLGISPQLLTIKE